MASHYRTLAAGCAVLLAGLAVLPTRAEAWWRGGVFIGLPPVVVAPPYYPPAYYPPPYYPPAYYPPPPVYNPQIYTPPGFTPPGFTPQGFTPPVFTPPGFVPPPSAEVSALRCYAGGYVCPLDYATPRGAACYCIGNGGQPAPGRVGG